MKCEQNNGTYTGFLAYVPHLRQTSTTNVIQFSLKNTHNIGDTKKHTGGNFVAWAGIAKQIANCKTSDEITVEFYVMKQKIFPNVKNSKGADLWETILNVQSVTVNGKTIRQEQNADGSDANSDGSLPFDFS